MKVTFSYILVVLALLLGTYSTPAEACSAPKGFDWNAAERRADRENRKDTKRVKGMVLYVSKANNGYYEGLLVSNDGQRKYPVRWYIQSEYVITCNSTTVPIGDASGVFYISKQPYPFVDPQEHKFDFHRLVDWEGRSIPSLETVLKGEN